jgi:DNA-binding CsgD family transcriptional regulator
MARLLTPKLAPETQVALTSREKEVLRWTAEGKTSYEISQILDVSERTVNFHVNNAVAKLGTSNKTQAAVKATALGMLY